MQKYNNNDIAAKLLGTRAISAVLQGTRVVWMAIRSCFGSGVWVAGKPWLSNEKWKS